MGITLKIGIQSGSEANSMTADADYSTFTLQQLLKARQWFDADRCPDRERWLEEEIHMRCAHFQEPTRSKGSTASGLGGRYRPYGLMFGAFFLAVSIGPFMVIEFLETMGAINVNGDNALLWSLWALLTLPFAVLVFMIGGIMDAERVVKWLDL